MTEGLDPGIETRSTIIIWTGQTSIYEHENSAQQQEPGGNSASKQTQVVAEQRKATS